MRANAVPPRFVPQPSTAAAARRLLLDPWTSFKATRQGQHHALGRGDGRGWRGAEPLSASGSDAADREPSESITIEPKS